ncbi:HvfA family oxazolone/thioamide-modified RiPP metallophore [Alcanivorax sediminis]|uniref:Low-complexity protein n=1 Tax=Alcanivorax sediminis TaxID=2663008 RepID=A0A6N7LWI0_9GAMM|nr:hypothetical protein [Alcanivorax sediminis]MQX53746.1 hypothetical protein [Alcanivorax sediminis]
MAKLTKMNPLAATVGAAFVASALSVPVAANAAQNPFAASDLQAGYQLAAHHAEGKCGEGKCGDKKAEGSCGEEKGAEGKCGEDKKGEGTCGGDKKGEGKCGGSA